MLATARAEGLMKCQKVFFISVDAELVPSKLLKQLLYFKLTFLQTHHYITIPQYFIAI